MKDAAKDARNDAQIEQWNGRTGLAWTRYARVLDGVLAPLGEAGLRTLELHAGQRVLDVGCGAGATTALLADAVTPSGQVLGVDISAPMLGLARERLGGRSHVELRECDAQSAELPARSRIFSRFGVMFFADPVRAFANLRACLAPTSMEERGRLTFVCWRTADDNPWATVPLAQLQGFLKPVGPPPDPRAPGPFAFADEHWIRDLLQQSGWSDIEIARHDETLAWTRSADIDEAVDLFAHIGRAASVLAELDEATRPRAREVLRATLEPLVGKNGLSLPSSVWVVSAR